MFPYRELIESSSRLADVELLVEVNQHCIADANVLLERIDPVLEATREIALQECEVPVEFKPDFFSHHSDDVLKLNKLSSAVRFASDVAAFNGDFDKAALYGIVHLDLANATRRGGLIVDHLVAVAISDRGVNALRSLRNRFDEGVRGNLLAALSRHEREREAHSEIVARDAKWEAESGCEDDGNELSEDDLFDPDSELSIEQQRDLVQFIKAFGNRPEAEMQAIYADLDRRALAMTRLLSVDLAIRSWKDRTGHYPHSIRELEPDILSSVPRDPFTDGDFIYRRSEDSFELYSTGPDKTDSGGQFGCWLAVASGGYDLCLDAFDCCLDCCAVESGPGLIRRLWSRLWSWRRLDFVNNAAEQ
ncbi:hypothetical protein K227x_07790 [Rubripirellula lacrimiformis]|uniref:Uncharacterized protein n=1 Tax=Rubripirellula lacrimiformis TaxID=1930273 RepID=A0A517N5K8_9BACT|nr:hypothetical protein K227x_07790 [Rubripirellula lacrimiformis]